MQNYACFSSSKIIIISSVRYFRREPWTRLKCMVVYGWSTFEWLTIPSGIYYQSANRPLQPLPIEFPLGEAMYSLFKFDTNACLLLGVIFLFLIRVAYLCSQTYKVKLGCKWKSTVSMPDLVLPPILSFDIFPQLGVAYPFFHTLTHFDSCPMLKNWLLKVVTT